MSNYPINPGILEVYCGPIKSGKTRELMNRVDKLNYMCRFGFIFFKPKIDTRNLRITSRFAKFSYECIRIHEQNPEEILCNVKKSHQLIVIDETQFFGKNIEHVVDRLLRKGKNVIIGGLDLDFRGEPFGSMPYFLSIADNVTKLTAVCDYEGCKKPATRTQRLINGKPAPYDSPLVLVGDKKIKGAPGQSYEARCLEHHIVPNKPQTYK